MLLLPQLKPPLMSNPASLSKTTYPWDCKENIRTLMSKIEKSPAKQVLWEISGNHYTNICILHFCHISGSNRQTQQNNSVWVPSLMGSAYASLSSLTMTFMQQERFETEYLVEWNSAFKYKELSKYYGGCNCNLCHLVETHTWKPNRQNSSFY